MTRIGFGYDAHRFAAGRKLMLGGVEIPHTHGLLGHSDADVLLHAVCDALLGAAALGDIGRHFPDTDPQYSGISSLTLLSHVGRLIREYGYTIGNIDSTVVMERPKVNPHVEAMRKVMGEALSIPPEAISIKATTNEGMGFVGTGEGAVAYAVALLHTK